VVQAQLFFKAEPVFLQNYFRVTKQIEIDAPIYFKDQAENNFRFSKPISRG